MRIRQVINAFIGASIVASCCTNASQFTPILGLSVGGSKLDHPSNQDINFMYDEFGQLLYNIYTTNSTDHINAVGNIHGGVLYPMPSRDLSITAEVLGFVNSNTSISGHVWEQGSALFDNFTYRYNVRSLGLMAESRIISEKYTLKPYLLGGIGSAWNTSHKYRQVANNDQAVSLIQPFPSRRSTNFSYEIGAGIGYNVKNTFISLEYKFQDLGQSQLGLPPSQLINDPVTAKIQSNQLMLNVTYLFQESQQRTVRNEK